MPGPAAWALSRCSKLASAIVAALPLLAASIDLRLRLDLRLWLDLLLHPRRFAAAVGALRLLVLLLALLVRRLTVAVLIVLMPSAVVLVGPARAKPPRTPGESKR